MLGLAVMFRIKICVRLILLCTLSRYYFAHNIMPILTVRHHCHNLVYIVLWIIIVYGSLLPSLPEESARAVHLGMSVCLFVSLSA